VVNAIGNDIKEEIPIIVTVELENKYKGVNI